MHRTIPVAHPLRRLFTAVTERSFLEGLGWPDREVIRYLAELLVDFTHIDNLHKIRNAQGRPVDEVVEMLSPCSSGSSQRTSSSASMASGISELSSRACATGPCSGSGGPC